MKVMFVSWRAALARCSPRPPWLSPIAHGPSPSVQPWLTSAACGIALWILAATGSNRPAVPPGLASPPPRCPRGRRLSHSPLRPEMADAGRRAALLVLAAGFARDPELARGLQAGLLAAAAVSAAIGLAQYFGVSAWFAPWSTRPKRARPTPTCGSRTSTPRFAGSAAPSCCSARCACLGGRGAALLVLLAAGSAASVSRTGMLQGLVLPRSPRCGADRGDASGCAVRAGGACLLRGDGAAARAAGGGHGRDAGAHAVGPRGRRGRLQQPVVLWSNVLHLIAQQPLARAGAGANSITRTS